MSGESGNIDIVPFIKQAKAWLGSSDVPPLIDESLIDETRSVRFGKSRCGAYVLRCVVMRCVELKFIAAKLGAQGVRQATSGRPLPTLCNALSRGVVYNPAHCLRRSMT